jgi:hypothetical protein
MIMLLKIILKKCLCYRIILQIVYDTFKSLLKVCSRHDHAILKTFFHTYHASENHTPIMRILPQSMLPCWSCYLNAYSNHAHFT